MYFYTKQEMTRFLEQGGQLPGMPLPINIALTYGLYGCLGITFVVLISLLFPFKNMGRALYDRIAGTVVDVD
jgi:hypothetical protein